MVDMDIIVIAATNRYMGLPISSKSYIIRANSVGLRLSLIIELEQKLIRKLSNA